MDGQGEKGTCSKEEAAMDSYLRSQGLHRKKIAKDGSCLFRAVAEQVMHSQSEHLKIRKSCIHYLRENRGQYEAFIEGSFEDYLKILENPQEWVGQVEISALSLMFKKDFIIYQEPNVPPACVTENGFSEKIMLCFSNGNHYDIIYPIGFAESAAMCQSIIYELLYEKVMRLNVGKYVVDEDTFSPTTTGEIHCSDASESETEDLSKNTKKNFADMNGFKSHKNDKCPQKKTIEPTPPPSVLRSLHTSHYRNVEYEVWLKTQRDQQKLDFSIAAGMQYSVGDKCQVRIEPGGKFYNAHIQEVENGPVTVFVEELGEKHAVQLKNLKPIPQTIISTDGWNTVAGKKQKKTLPSGTNTQAEKDNRGQKGFGKPVKQQAAQSLRLQQAVGNKQHGLSSQLSDQSPQSENKGRSRTPPKVPGRKVDRERSEESNYFKRENVSFGLTVEERKEKEAIEESKSLYEMQSMDKDAFPALSSLPKGERAVQKTEVVPVKRMTDLTLENTRKGEDQKDKAQATKVRDQKSSEDAVKEFTPPDADDLPSAPVLPTAAEHQASPAVPSTPPVITAWPGVQAQIPSLPAMGPDLSLLQPQVTSSPYPPLPAVNQPLLPLPQALQDPLYPGFPLNDQGERATVPSCSFCKNGGDLPDDNSILRFFFNLGLKAYTYPMWPPHSHLYPLHQAYITMCRIYPAYPQGSWVQEMSANQSEVDPSNLPHPSEVRMESQGSQPATVSSPPVVASPVQVPGIVGQIPNPSESGVINQGFHANVNCEEPTTSKTIFPQPPFGQSSYMGAVPIASSYFPHYWYSYPYQGYIESPVIRHNVYIPPQDRDLPESLSSEDVVEINSANQIAIRQSLDLQEQCKPDLPLAVSAGGIGTELVSNASTVQSEQMMNVNTVLTDHKSLPSKMKDNQVPPLAFTQVETREPAYGTSEDVEQSEKEFNAGALGGTQMKVSEEVALRPREESSEDEREVSSMLSSGRSKNFYSQSYNTRRPRNEKYYQPNRGGYQHGYQHGRGEESWRGQRGRDDGFHHHRSYRGRPYRRRPMGDSYRAQQE